MKEDIKVVNGDITVKSISNTISFERSLRKDIKIPIYFGDLILILTDDTVAESKKLGHSGEDFENPKCPAYAYSDTESNGYDRYFIVMTKECTASIVAHEALHCVNYIFKDRGIKADLDNDEPAAYLLGWIVEQCHDFLDKNLNKLK